MTLLVVGWRARLLFNITVYFPVSLWLSRNFQNDPHFYRTHKYRKDSMVYSCYISHGILHFLTPITSFFFKEFDFLWVISNQNQVNQVLHKATKHFTLVMVTLHCVEYFNLSQSFFHEWTDCLPSISGGCFLWAPFQCPFLHHGWLSYTHLASSTILLFEKPSL